MGQPPAMLPTDIVLDAVTPIGFRVQCTAARWSLIEGLKHPAMKGRLDDVRTVLEDPDQVRRSQHDRRVVLFHRRIGRRFLSAVARYDLPTGVLVTDYPADRIKSGELLWTR